MKILIFGAAGFIGSHLARHAASHGHTVVCFCRSGRVSDFEGTCHAWSLGGRIDDAAIADADCALHLAHDFDGEEGAERTLVGTLGTIERLRQAGVRRQIVFSSYSAGPQASSVYGKTKSAIEQKVLGMPGIVIVRPGLVLGDGGLYGRMQKFVRLSPLVPLPGGGCGMVPVITIEKLCRYTLDIVVAATPLTGYNLFDKQLLSLKQIVQNAARVTGRRIWVLPVPTFVVLFCLRTSAALRIPLPVNADNLQGFLANQEASHVSSLADV